MTHASKVAAEIFKKNELSDKTKTVIFDMFKERLPAEFDSSSPVDLVFYSQILHDWPVDAGVKLLKKAHESLPKGGAVLIHEKLLTDDRGGPVPIAMVRLYEVVYIPKLTKRFVEHVKHVVLDGGTTIHFQETFGNVA